ncbi:MAG: chromosomal replication initiator protein DnaA [Lachnospiraceae bacterium]|nr:chromosomal replication initiator protein DnaA [Lachnospiraceae bacterium]
MKEKLQAKWPEILEYMKNEYNITPVSFKTWLQNLSVYDLDENIVIISVQNTILGDDAIEFIKNKYGIYIKTAIAEVTGEDYEISFINHSEIERRRREEEEKKVAKTKSPFFNYTFDNFVVGENNNIAQASALAVAEMPGQVYNPLFIYGNPGLGKTHLMYAIANYISENRPDLKVLYTTTDAYVHDYVQSVRPGAENYEPFRNKYRTNDVLLIDDIQFIIDKEATQLEFFHTFNEMKESGRQIIISSDRPPREFTVLEERLRSRFEMGLTVDIQPPTYETRLAILNNKAQSENISIKSEVLAYIAENVKLNIRELEGAFNRIVAMGRLQRREINIDFATEALKDIISPNEKQVITPERVIRVVADHYNLTEAQLASSDRSKNIAHPRQISMYLCSKLCPDSSLNDIAKCLGDRDHSTIIHGRDTIKNKLEKDESLKNNIETIIKKINPPD